MKFKRLVSGVAALTVAVSTFAAFTINAYAAGKIIPSDTKMYALKVIDGSGTWLNENKKVTVLNDFKENVDEWNSIQLGGTLSNEFIDDTYKENHYIIEAIGDSGVSASEMDQLDSSVEHSNNVVNTGFEMTQDGDLKLDTKTYYWHTITVHKAKDFTLSVQKIIDGRSSAFGSDELASDIDGFSSTEGWKLNETSVDEQSGTGKIQFPRFVKNGNDAYQFAYADSNDTDIVKLENDTYYEVTVNKSEFAKKKQDKLLRVAYQKYVPDDVPSTAKLFKIVEASGGSDESTASMGKKGGSSVEITGLNGGQKYYFVVTHDNNSTLQGTTITGLTTMYLDTSKWQTSVTSAIAKGEGSNGTATITVSGGDSPSIDTVLVYSTDTENFKLNITASGADNFENAPNFEDLNKAYIKGDDSIEDVTYSYPRYLTAGGKLYKSNGVTDNGKYTADNGTYTMTIDKDSLKNFTGTGSYNVNHVYGDYTYPGLSNNAKFVGLDEVDNENESVEGASMGTAKKLTNSSGNYSYTVTGAGKHTLVVRYKGDLGASYADSGSYLTSATDWTEQTITATVKRSDGNQKVIEFENTSGDAYIDTILDYSEQVVSSIDIKLDDKNTFDTNVSDENPAYTAYKYVATMTEGTDNASFNINVEIDGQTHKTGINVPNTTISGSPTIYFGVIAPVGKIVTPKGEVLPVQ